MKRFFYVAMMATAGVVFFSVACTKKNEQEFAKSVCTTDSMSYSNDIVPILENNCYGCHGNGNTGGSGGINLDGYTNLKVKVENGQLVGCVTHASGYPPMPYNLPKLPDCEISKIVAWVDQGAHNN